MFLIIVKMKKVITAALMLCCCFTVCGQAYVPTAENLAARQRFEESRFGIFLHWGLYATFGQGEWYMTNANVDCHEYAKAANAFYPHSFDAERWVAAIKAAGARYITFTSRHHEGFSMWDTKQSDYNIMHTPYGRDVVRQLADACHRQGVSLHLYYSHLDWTREDYPLGRTGLGTGRKMASRKGDWDSYFRFMNAQLTELLTQYGEIGAIWFDGWWDHDGDSIPFDWHLGEQYALIHRLQPACLVGNNHHQAPFEGEDFQMFERDVPGENTAGYSGQAISHLPLETCQTMNGMWGYKVVDQNYKSATELIRLLARTASKGANLLLNIGPQPDGNLPDTALARLQAMGDWMQVNGESIYGTQAGGVTLADGAVVSTAKDGKLFLHVLSDTITGLSLPREAKVRRVTAMDGGASLPFRQRKGQLTFTVSVPRGAADYVVVVE